MSLNSLQDNMSRRATSMAAMAQRATNPQDIQAIQQSLVNGVQNGSIQPYVGIPLIQELTNKLTEVKAQMAQTMAGMQQGPQGAPIAEQVMQQAAQESQGLEALPSNLPQEYAGGGIIAFEDGGEVQHFQDGGSPVSRYFGGLREEAKERNDAAALRNKLQTQYGPKAAIAGFFMNQSDAEREAAKNIVGRLPTMTLPQLQALYDQGPSALPPVTSAVAPTPTPAAAPLAPPPPAAKPPVAPAVPVAPTIPNSSFKMPTLQTYTPTAATLPERTLPVKTDFAKFIRNAPEEAQAAFDTARTKEEDYLRKLTEPGEKAREEKFSKREAAQEKDSAMGRALNLISLGLGIAGSKERSVAGALGKEGREGIADLIRGEAANRVAKERLEDARDNFEQQKILAAKGDRSAANAAGQRAAEDKRAYTQLNMQAAQFGSSEASQRFQLEQTGDIAKSNLFNEGERQKMSAVDQQNRNTLGLGELGLRSDQLAQQGAIANAQLVNNLAVAQIRANRESGITPYQMARLRGDAEKNVDPDAVRAALAKQLKISKAPVPGADESFDNKFKIAYDNEINGYINRVLGVSGGSGGSGDFGAVNSLLDKYAPKR